MKGFFLLIIILILGGGGYYAYQQQGRILTDSDMRPMDDPSPVDDERLAVFFRDELIAKAVERIGFPIEGFDATLLMQAFPDLQEDDFEGVESFEGYYTITDIGTLEFVRSQESPISSAERTVSNDGYHTLLHNVSDRLEIDIKDEASVMILITMLVGDALSSVPVMTQYNGKTVYTVDAVTDPDPLRADCSMRGGVFNECGTTCAPGAEVCTSVCAFTCEY